MINIEFGHEEPMVPVTDEEYNDNLIYANTRIAEYREPVKTAMGAGYFSKFKVKMKRHINRSSMNDLGSDWRDFFDLMLKFTCEVNIENQYNYSNKEFRKKLTADVIIEKCNVLMLSTAQTINVLKDCGYKDEAEKIKADCGILTH